MTAPRETRYIFADQLRLEAENILEDVVFERSPVQSRLLRYLVEATLRDGPPPTQYEIAVDGLGKDPDFDLANDSYPRVQISRLRTNLDNYYARNQPIGGVRIVIKQGKYSLDLVRMVESEPASPIASISSEVAWPGAAAERSASTRDRENDGGWSFEFDPLGFDDEEPEPDPVIVPQSLTPRGRRWRQLARKRLTMLYALVGLTVVLLALLVFDLRSPSQGGSAAQPVDADFGAVPTVALYADVAALDDEGSLISDEVELALRRAEIQLANSFVSRAHVEGSEIPPAYQMKLDFGRRGSRAFDVFMTLTSADGTPLFNTTVLFDPARPEAFEQDLSAALVYATSPVGAISKDQLSRIDGDPQSSYACFILVESRRSEGRRTGPLVDRCIASFPDGSHAPFLFARRAFSQYQAMKLAGQPIARSGPAWRDVMIALEKDRFNAFANFVAAKVELANENCRSARAHIDNAFERSSSYPALLVAIEAETSSCPGYTDDAAMSTDQLRAMIEHNPAPDALLHLYLLIAALGAGDRESAEHLASGFRFEAESGKEEETIRLLQEGMANPRFAAENEGRIRADVGLFVWGREGVDRVFANLIDPRPLT